MARAVCFPCQTVAEFNGWPISRGNAIDWANNGDGKNYKFIKNFSTFVPKGGDFAIFQTGKYGHIGVVYSATVKEMNVFQQNDPVGSPAKQKIYNYIKPKCVGFLRKI
jgi:surface antigen